MDFAFNPDRTVLGTVFTHAGEEQLVLSEADRLKHMLVIGKTGMGKTTLLKNMAVQDMHAGRGLGLIDPHGDLSRELLDQFPAFRARDLIYIDPGDETRVVTFNVLARVPREQIAARAADVLAAFHAVWANSWGPRLERILYNAIAAMIEAPNTSLLGLPRLLKDERYRARVLEHVSDPIVHGFFAEEYAVWDDDFRIVAIDPVLNKIEQLLSSPFVRATLGTTTSSIDFAEIMDQGKILLANLSKGNLGEGHAHLLGAMLVSSFAQAAMARGANDRIRRERRPFFLIVDEFQNFSTQSFASILSESRKWGLSLVLAHQFLQQADEDLRAAVLGNVGSIIAFQLSGDDAETIAAEIGLQRPAALTELGLAEAWLKHATYGGPHFPHLLAPIVTNAKGRDAALKQSRMRTYSRARVEEKITKFLSRDRAANAKAAPRSGMRSSPFQD
jgi:hypothetical protein